MTVREVLKALRKDGWYTTNQEGSHISLKHPIPANVPRAFLRFKIPESWFLAKRIFCGQFRYHGFCLLHIVPALDHQRNDLCDLFHILFYHTAGRHGRGSQSHAACHKGRPWVVGDGVLVCRYMGIVQTLLQLFSAEILFRQVYEYNFY